MTLMNLIDALREPKPALKYVIPAAWLPNAPMKRIVGHWNGGGYIPSSLDKEHYHFLIDGDLVIHRGLHPVTANIPPLLSQDDYAAHTKGTNSYAIGVSICCMAGAMERPYVAGLAPMKKDQWEKYLDLLAVLAQRYDIPVTDKTILSHAEVQANLGVKQNGKWDFSVLPFDRSVKGAKAVGDLMRKGVLERLK